MTIQATPAKLKTGAWGARVAGTPVQVGDDLTITSQAGKTWNATVAQIVWQGSGVTLVATGSATQAQGGACENCQRPAARLIVCVDSDARQGRCCPSCARLAEHERAF